MRSPCAVYNGGCSHICLLSLTSGSRRSCRCPTTMRLRKDKKTCESLCKYRIFLTYLCRSEVNLEWLLIVTEKTRFLRKSTTFGRALTSFFHSSI